MAQKYQRQIGTQYIEAFKWCFKVEIATNASSTSTYAATSNSSTTSSFSTMYTSFTTTNIDSSTNNNPQCWQRQDRALQGVPLGDTGISSWSCRKAKLFTEPVVILHSRPRSLKAWRMVWAHLLWYDPCDSDAKLSFFMNVFYWGRLIETLFLCCVYWKWLLFNMSNRLSSKYCLHDPLSGLGLSVVFIWFHC